MDNENLLSMKPTAKLEKNMETEFDDIPCGLGLYQYIDKKVVPLYRNAKFFEILGLLPEHKGEMDLDAVLLGVHPDDTALFRKECKNTVIYHEAMQQDFRIFHHLSGEYRWIHMECTMKNLPDGSKLVYAVFRDAHEQVRLANQLAKSNAELQATQKQMEHLINSIPGGIATYRVEGGKFKTTFLSNGVMELSGHTREEYETIVKDDAANIIYEQDKPRALAAAKEAIVSGEVLEISYRIYHRDGHLVWVHLSGRRMGPFCETPEFYAVFTGISAETRLFQNIANEMADGIYVIDMENYDLLYASESAPFFIAQGKNCVGEKCYTALHGKSEPCAFCTLKSHRADGTEHQMVMEGSDRHYATKFRETQWNGIPAYVKYVWDVTEEVKTRQEKEQLEQYYQSVLENLPGGVAVIRLGKDGDLTPEYLSEGFAAMTGMSLEEAWAMYRQDATVGLHPDDVASFTRQFQAYIANANRYCTMIYRLIRGDGSYVWVKNNFTRLKVEGADDKLYAVYNDVTGEIEEQERLQLQYKDMLMQYYSTPNPDALLSGHCNVTQNKIIEYIDHTTDLGLLENLGPERDAFFSGLSQLIVDGKERQAFLERFLTQPMLEAFEQGDLEHVFTCLLKLPSESVGRYGQFIVKLVTMPYSGDVVGILNVIDVTNQKIAEQIIRTISLRVYDFVADVDLLQDHYWILTPGKDMSNISALQGSYSKQVSDLVQRVVFPRDKACCKEMLQVDYILERLQKEDAFSLSYSMADEKGDIRIKNTTVTAVDLRLGRVAFARNDITESVREQQGLLHMLAYTFDLACFINVSTKTMSMYTREALLENRSPYTMVDYNQFVVKFVQDYSENREETERLFRLEHILDRLAETPRGYDFIFSYTLGGEERYKQVNVVWGDEGHSTICLVRADVTDVLREERRTKRELENALMVAEQANRAKSDFLSAMSHDIRTPMNAIMGMTMMAENHLDDQERVADCLKKISISSKHLLSLINDVLDMSRIENRKTALHCEEIFLPELLDSLETMLKPQSKEADLALQIQSSRLWHKKFWGDPLRLNQILINLLSNALKFTPAGGSVHLLVEELEQTQDLSKACYCFTVSDTGMGMSPGFLQHIFEPFTRGQDSIANRIEGTGLGLSITKGLVDLMGGKIGVESQEGVGSTFRVELAFAIMAPKTKENHQAVTASLPLGAGVIAGRRFLIVEDNDINAEIISEILLQYHAHIMVQKDGAQAVQAFQEAEPGTFDAILMDIQMPVLNGYEATRRIRALPHPNAKRIPIIAMTANAFHEDVQAALDAGMNAHIAKPVDVGLLIRTLQTVLPEQK